MEHLVVILFSSQRDPIPPELRLGWLMEDNPGLDLRHVVAEQRQDYDDPDIWDQWMASIRSALPEGPDVVFTSEAYGDEMARRLGAEHICVDPERQARPVSGTAVRENPYRCWDHLSPAVRAHFTLRVALCGAESTGKTVLAEKLARRFNTIWTPEYGRLYFDARPGPCTPEDLLAIARGQYALQEEAARRANRLLIMDTDILTTMIFGERFFGAAEDELQQMARSEKTHLYLLADNDVPFVPDSQRESGHLREWFKERYIREFEERGLPYRIFGGDYAAREEQAAALIAEFLASRGVELPELSGTAG